MFGIGTQELILILVIALIIFGPHKLPEMTKSIGKAMRQFQDATKDVREGLSLSVDDDDDDDDDEEPEAPSAGQAAPQESTTGPQPGVNSSPSSEAETRTAPAAGGPPRNGKAKSGSDQGNPQQISGGRVEAGSGSAEPGSAV